MKNSLGIINKSFEWSCYLLVTGLFFSRALLSITCVLIFILGLFTFLLSKRKLSRVTEIKKLFFLIYLAFITSVIYSEDYSRWFNLVFKGSILFLIPVGFLFAKPLKEKRKHVLLFFFSLLGFISTFINTIGSLTDYSSIIKKASIGQNISPLIGPSHSASGLLSSVGIIILCWLLPKYNNNLLKWILSLIVLVWVICLHVIAYRFSLVTIYIIGFLFLLYTIFKYSKKTRLLSIILAVSLLILPIVFYNTLLPFKGRVNNSINDINTIINSSNPNYHSLAQRWASIKCVIEIINEHPIIGVSPADLKEKMRVQYQENSYLLIPDNRIYVHNQVLFYAASFGIPFTFIIIFSFFLIIAKEIQRDFNFLWLILPFLFHMQIEITMEGQITGVFMIFILLLFDNRQCNEKNYDNSSNFV